MSKLIIIVAIILNILMSMVYVTEDVLDDKPLEFSHRSDARDDWSIGQNLWKGNGYIVTWRGSFACIEPPCDGRFRNPLYPLILAPFPSWMVFVYSIVFSIPIILFLYKYGGWMAAIGYATLNRPIITFLSGNHEALYFLLFIICMYCLRIKKAYGWAAISNILLILARFQVGAAFLAAFIAAEPLLGGAFPPILFLPFPIPFLTACF